MQANSKVDFVIVEKFDNALLSAAAHLHVEHLSYRSFITLFGPKFITEIYRDILSGNLGFFVFALDGGKVCGFVLGCTNTRLFFSLIKRKPFKYFALVAPRLMAKPQLFKKLFETLFYVDKENSAIDPELIVIVTDSEHRGRGIGSTLVSVLNGEFRKRGIREYKVTVHDEMKRSNSFYLKIGMKLLSSFTMYGTKWNLYRCKIEQ